MKIKTQLIGAFLTLCAFSFSGCGEPPQPVDAPAAGAPTAAAPHGAMPKAGMANTGEEARIAGTIVFEGEQFAEPTGTLFVNVRLKGQKAPWLSRMYPIAGTKIAASASGVRSMPFELRSRDPEGLTSNLNGQHAAPSECEVYVCYKAERFVESKTLADALALFESGKTDYQMTLKLP